MRRLNLIRYFGGKSYLVNDLLKIIPDHICYVEVFGGAGNLLLNKPPSKIEVYNDINGNLANLFLVVSDYEKCKEFQRRLSMIPYARCIRKQFLEDYLNGKFYDDIDRAVKTYYVYNTSFAGRYNAGFGFSKKRNQMIEYLNKINKMPYFHNRLMLCCIENLDCFDVIDKYDGEDTLFYLDPPYDFNARKSSKQAYEFEFTDEQHNKLVDKVLNIKGKVLITHFVSDIYQRLIDNGWNYIDFDYCLHSKKEENTRREKIIQRVYMNYEIENLKNVLSYDMIDTV